MGRIVYFQRRNGGRYIVTMFINIDWFGAMSLLVLKKNEVTYTANALLMILCWSVVSIWISCTT